MLRGDSTTNKDDSRSIQCILRDKISIVAPRCTDNNNDECKEKQDSIEQSIAIVASNGSRNVSFFELWSVAGYIAHKLKTKCGVQPNDRIGIVIPNGSVTTSYILAMMGVLYCGGVYVPIAISSTKSGNVVKSILDMAGCVAVIDLRSCEDSISQEKNGYISLTTPAHTNNNNPYHDLGWGGPCLRLEPLVFLLDQIKAESSSSSSSTTKITYPYQHAFHEGSRQDEACLLFTSGSTGTPKGVILTHEGILCRINWSARTYPMIHEEDTILCHLAATTLGGTMLPLTGLMQGCSIFIAPPEVVIDTNQFAKMLVLHRVNTLITMPSLLKNLLKIKDGQAMRNMKTIYLTGEAYDDTTLRNVAVASPNATLINLYGMTETTGHTIAYTYDRGCGAENMRAYMGLPTDNTTAIMIDPENEADSGTSRNSVGDISFKPNESMGELCVSGIGLSKGYVDEQLNKDKFFYHDGMKFFRTGDSVELVTDASNEKTLRYVGRADRCVKVNGFRVELDGVERGLCKVDGVTSVAAIMTKKHGYEHQSTLQIVGFVSPDTLDGSIVRDRCFTFLPKHEVPLKVYAMDSLPLTITGKIDRKALEYMIPDQGQQRKAVVDDTSVTNIARDEHSIVERIMNECNRHIEIHDPDMSIFDAGATSVIVVALLHDLEPLPLSASTVYKYKSPTKIASKIMKDVADGTAELMDDPGMAGSYMLSHAGRMGLGKGFSFPGIFFFMAYFLNLALVYLRSQNTATSMINMSISFHSEVDVEKLKAALVSAMRTFPTLRSRFQKTYSSMPIFGQFLYDIEDTVSILEHSESSLPLKIISNGATWYKHERRRVIQRISKGDESLVEFILVQGQTLHIYCDHITCDLTSLVMLSKFVIDHYNGDFVSAERRRFKDFPVWQHGLKIDTSTSNDSLILTATPHYGIPKRLTSFIPFSVKCQELFLQPVPIKHCVPNDVRNIRIVFLTLWHSVLMDHGGPSNIAVTESIDLRHSSFLNGFERTFGYMAHAPVISNLKYSSSKSLVANMQDLQKDLSSQEEEMSLWSKAHGPDTTVLSEGWHFNFIGTRMIPKMKGATIHPRGFIPRRTNIIQRHPTIQVEVFYNDNDLMFQISYCVMRVSGQTIRAIGDDLVERFHAFRSS